MRTKVLACAAALAATAFAANAQVYSQNVVGYVNRTIPGGGQFAIVANPLDSGNNVLTNVLQQLPPGAKVTKWVPGTGFQTFTKVTFGAGWTPSGSGTNTFAPGEGAFISLPSGSNAFTATFVGNVVQGPVTNAFVPGYSIQSDPVPVTDSMVNVGLTAALPGSPTGSKLQFWDETAQGYVTYTRVTFGGGWTPTTIPAPTNTLGQGYFIFNSASTNRLWTQSFTVQ